jgi:hypothetical protein
MPIGPQLSAPAGRETSAGGRSFAVRRVGPFLICIYFPFPASMFTCTTPIPSPSRDASRIVLRLSVCILLKEARSRAMSRSRRPPARGSRALILPVYTERSEPALIRRGGEASEIEGSQTAKLLDTPCKAIFPVSHSKQTFGAIIKCHTFQSTGLPVSTASRAWEIGRRSKAAVERNLASK